MAGNRVIFRYRRSEYRVKDFIVKTTNKTDNGIQLPEALSEVNLLFETSWEVCNKVGGIYTVLSTKSRTLAEQFGSRLVFIGPDVWTKEQPSPYFIERKSLLKDCSSKLELPYGIKIRAGRWNLPGSPQVVLVKFDGVYEHLNDIYGMMWEKYNVDSLHSYGDYAEGCAFGVASAIVIKALSQHLKANEEKVIAHFDEWTTGMGLLYLQQTMPKAATVFTTHATSIGRSICGNGKPLYDYFHGYNGDQMAQQLNMQSKHSLEKAAAHSADCFTTVSEVTARECEQLLEIRPQVVTPNGFEPDFVPKTVKYNRLRKEGRDKILKIAKALTGEDFADDPFIIATSGRNEYRNKGIDLFLDAMVQLDKKLDEPNKTIALVLVPAWVNEPSGALLMNLSFNGTEKVEPDFLTHRLNNEDSDNIAVRIGELERAGELKNVKVIYVPVYLDGHDGIVDITYYDILPAIDLTLFPSYYEPWGYTPLESVAFGVPTVTTDKAGFGQWVLDNFKNDLNACGVKVIARTDSNYAEDAASIAEEAFSYEEEPASMRMKAKAGAFDTSKQADWKFFISDYDKAYQLALDRAWNRAK